MSETETVVVDLPKPSFLKRIPVKKVALVALVAASAILIAKSAKDQLALEASDSETVAA